ncbi:cytochrome P450 2B4-like [Saccostrea echinata]|uniref:cytochrome P450 2B4-like n=1 Tax=Saccostrea echinata TaxID=191078 RepID=UPI002A827A04|nr:cytochrome P450 2B4-like [Saccostrea echinata]
MLFHILHFDFFLNPIIGLCFALMVCFFILKRVQSRLQSLPGPTRWPVVGNIPDLAFTRQTYRRLLEFRDKYGDIVQLRLGPSLTVVVVFGHEYLNELLVDNGDKTKFRPNWLHLPNKLFQKTGVLWSNGEEWYSLRKFTMNALKELGFGTSNIEERILNEAEHIIKAIQSSNKDEVDLRKFIPKAVSNIISGIVFGDRFDYEDKEFKELLENLDYIFKHFGYQQPSIFFPALESVDLSAQKISENMDKIYEYCQLQIKRHRETYHPQIIRDFIDMYIEQLDTGVGELSERSLFQIIFDLYAAGSETSSTGLLWVIFYLIKYPVVQKKCRSEIKRVIGLDATVSFSDKEKLPYVTATINEVQRMSTLGALSLPRTSLEDVEIDGKVIPKNSVIIPHIYSAHYDTRYWQNPEEFKPERFIDKERHIIKHKAFYPFSIGPRACPGKQLGEMEMFIFAVSLMQQFEFSSVIPPEDLSTEGLQTGVTLVPSQYSVRIKSS